MTSPKAIVTVYCMCPKCGILVCCNAFSKERNMCNDCIKRENELYDGEGYDRDGFTIDEHGNKVDRNGLENKGEGESRK